MALLSDIDRQRIGNGLRRFWSAKWEIMNFLRDDVKDAVDATDTWIDTNQASFNAALPDAFRNNATPEQKTILFCAVALMRTNPEFLKRIFGEVD